MTDALLLDWGSHLGEVEIKLSKWNRTGEKSVVLGTSGHEPLSSDLAAISEGPPVATAGQGSAPESAIIYTPMLGD